MITFEKLKEIRDKHPEEGVDNQQVHELIDLAIDARIPKQIVDGHHCPCCGTGLPRKGFTSPACAICYEPNFCPECGQKLNWNDTPKYATLRVQVPSDFNPDECGSKCPFYHVEKVTIDGYEMDCKNVCMFEAAFDGCPIEGVNDDN